MIDSLKILFKRGKFINLILIAISTFFFLTILLIVFNASYALTETKTSSTLHGDNLYRVMDTLYGKTESDFLSEASSYERLYNFNWELQNHPEMPFYLINTQPIGVIDFKGADIFDPAYEYGEESGYWNLNSGNYKVIRSVQLNEVAYKLNNITLANGKGFNENDFKLSGNRVPLLLGSDYRGIYNIGDTINFAHYFIPFKGEVIGFFNTSQTIIGTKDEQVLLDRVIVIPNLLPSKQLVQKATEKALKTREEEIFVKASLLANINGLIVTDENEIKVNQYLQGISQKADFPHITILNQSTLGVKTLARVTSFNSEIVYVSLAVIMSISLFLFFFLLLKKNRKERGFIKYIVNLRCDRTGT